MTEAERFVFIEALERAGLEPFTYSGRFMYGKKCPAVLWRNCPVVIGALALDAADEENKQDVLHILQSTRQDNMGLKDMVYYWPNVEWIGEELEQPEEGDREDGFD